MLKQKTIVVVTIIISICKILNYQPKKISNRINLNKTFLSACFHLIIIKIRLQRIKLMLIMLMTKEWRGLVAIGRARLKFLLEKQYKIVLYHKIANFFNEIKMFRQRHSPYVR